MTDPDLDHERTAFAQVVTVLMPYLNTIVIAGGWAHRLFRLDALAASPPFEPLATHDADIAVLAGLDQRGKPMNALLNDLGFKEVLGSDFTPPVTRYVRDDFEVEFITPLQGSETKRGKPDATLAVAGVTAQKLRYVDLLTERPRTIELREDRGYPVGPTPIAVRIPNPASFIAQKLLAARYRAEPIKRAKDLLYVHDTLTLFRATLPSLREEWRAVRATQHASVVRKLREQCERAFASDSLFLAPAIAIARSSGRPDVSSPAAFAKAGREGLREVFELP